MKEVMLAIVRLGDGFGLFMFLATIVSAIITAGVVVYISIENYHDMQVKLASADKCYIMSERKLLDGRTQSVVLNTCTGEVSMADLERVEVK